MPGPSNSKIEIPGKQQASNIEIVIKTVSYSLSVFRNERAKTTINSFGGCE